MNRKFWLRDLLDTLNSPGGHILICLGLLIGYARVQGLGLGHDIAIFALGVLSRSMGTASNPPALVSTSLGKIAEETINRYPNGTVDIHAMSAKDIVDTAKVYPSNKVPKNG